MSLADTIERKIRAERATRLKRLALPSEFIAPNYGGRSIANLAASIIRILGGTIRTAPLEPALIQDFATGVDRIVLVIADAVGYVRLIETLETNPHNGFHALLRAGARLAPLTSVFPSTTTAALTTLWSGYTPAEHGLVGYQLFLRDYGARTEMIGFSPVATKELGSEQLLAAGLEPDKFLAAPSLPQTLAPVGAPVYHFIEEPYVESALARVQIRGARETRGFVSSSDMWVALREHVEAHRAERALFVAYWSAADSIAHRYGASSETVVAEINNLAFSGEREFLRRLSPAARAGTLFLFVADHGQIDTPPHAAVCLRDHPRLRDRLLMDFTGDPRAAYLYCRNGEVEAVREYFKTHLADEFVVVEARSALEGGLFGSGDIAPEVKHRLGDLIVLARGNSFLWDRAEESKMLGRHGGLAAEEMLVPLIAARLDG